MHNIIIGTAGHVDHGKTCLIKALTGTDTDRLIEEKKRGITIELGFAHMEVAPDISAGIVDVPGHERFIKNMLAGAGGMDMALLVVAADEGVMPQTREHLSILSLLRVQAGVIAVTKADLVEPDWLELVCEEIAEEVRGTFLEGAPILPVSSYTGQGLEELRAAILSIAENAVEKDRTRPFRIPIDRVFTMEGFGVVITGTLIEGTLCKGSEAMIYPRGVRARVRNVQVHNQDVEEAVAGQRVAVNLTGIKKEDLDRGDVLACVDSMAPTQMVDARLTVLPECERVLQNGQRLHLYAGTQNVLAKLVLLDREELRSGQEAYVQLRLSEPLAVKTGDSYIVRFYSPLETVGGGQILEAHARKHRRYDEAVCEGLRIKEHGTPQQKLLQALYEESAQFPTVRALCAAQGMSEAQAEAALRESDDAVCIAPGRYVHRAYVQQAAGEVQRLLREYHEQNPLIHGLRVDEVRNRLFANSEAAPADGLLRVLAQQGAVQENDGVLSCVGFAVQRTPEQQMLWEALLEWYDTAAFTPPDWEQVQKKYPRLLAALSQVQNAMVTDGELVPLMPGVFLAQKHYERAIALLREIQARDGEISLGAFRDACETSRKYALALLETFDKRGITRKTGDMRHLTQEK